MSETEEITVRSSRAKWTSSTALLFLTLRSVTTRVVSSRALTDFCLIRAQRPNWWRVLRTERCCQKLCYFHIVSFLVCTNVFLVLLQRPAEGYNITVCHEMYDEVNNYRTHHWKVCPKAPRNFLTHYFMQFQPRNSSFRLIICCQMILLRCLALTI